MKVQKSIKKYVSQSETLSSDYGPVTCQFSSIGNISENWFKKFVSSLSCQVVKDNRPLGNLADTVKLVWPTGEDVRLSQFGYKRGNAVPGTLKNLDKPFLNPLYCKWYTRPWSLIMPVIVA